jgi:hypothetical protein
VPARINIRMDISAFSPALPGTPDRRWTVVLTAANVRVAYNGVPVDFPVFRTRDEARKFAKATGGRVVSNQAPSPEDTSHIHLGMIDLLE